MRIQTLSLHNFRNFKRAHEIEFPKAPLLVAAAPNATGKTNFLESIFVLLRGKSFRAPHEECVQWGEDYFLVQGEVEQSGEDMKLSVQYHTPSRKLRIEENGMPVSPVTFYSHYPFILFLPEDTFMFHRGPGVRRNFFNATLISSPHYLASVVQYQRALRQRNAALKDAKAPEDVQVWTDLLVQHAAALWSHRQAFAKYLETRVSPLYENLSGESHQFEVMFVPGASNPEQFQEILQEAWPYEQRYKYTLYGPHRDDLRIMVDGRPVSAVLSRGQMRGLVIALKVAAFGFMKQLTRQEPLLLFDEVLSELDEQRQRTLLEHLPNAQTLLTCTSVPEGIKRQEGVHMLDLRQVINASKEETTLQKKDVPVKSDEALTKANGETLEIVEENQDEQIAVRS